MWRAVWLLPVVLFAACRSGGSVVRVTRTGRVLFRGKSRSVTELVAAAAKRGHAEPLELHADGDALWMHVQWVMAALGEAGHARVRCGVEPSGRAQGFASVRLYSGRWDDKLFLLPQEQVFHTGIEIGSDREYRLHGPTTTRDPGAVAAWAQQRHHGLKPNEPNVGQVTASGAVRYRHVAVALAALRDAGAQRLEVGLEALHPWDRDRRRLPPPPHEDPIPRWFVTDRSLIPLYPLNLPVARMGRTDVDNDADARVILSLNARGQLFHERNRVTLAEFAAVLATKVRTYERKKGVATTSDGRRWSKLYVLVRADRNALFRHVQWIIAELREAGVYRLQFGARWTPGRHITPAEADRRWAAWEILFPEFLAKKLHCHLTTGEHTAVGNITAPPNTRFAKIIAKINALAWTRIKKFDFKNAKRAPEPIRQAQSLPR